MTIELKVREVFRLSTGNTVFACDVDGARVPPRNSRCELKRGDEVRQTLILSGETQLLNKNAAVTQRAFETPEQVELSPEEARSGQWRLMCVD